MLTGAVLFALATLFLMAAAAYAHRRRGLHVAVMALVMVADLLMPFYLYLTRDWYGRLIEEGDIWSFLVWTHLGLLIALYVLYALQLGAGRRLWRGETAARAEHRAQAKGILLVRTLVVLSGALLAEPPDGL